MSKPRLCLNMIVKNETAVLKRCFDSVLPYVDAWTIVDTGSSDGTQRLIREYFEAQGIAGELFERPWRDFGANRNEALELARGRAEHALIIDADEALEADAGFRMPELTADAHQILTVLGGTSYYRTQVVRLDRPWRWEGVLHEYLAIDGPFRSERIAGLRNIPRPDGSRSADPDKYRKDAQVLEAALAKEPNNARYVFYLGQSYRDARDPENAILAYDRRSKMGGFEEEAWYSDLMVARLLAQLGRSSEAVARWLAAFERRPTRAETLVDLARHQRSLKNFHLAHLFAGRALEIPRPANDVLFLEDAVYRYRAIDERAVAAFWCGFYAETRDLCRKLLADPSLPAEERARIERNLAFALEKLPA